jgi:hypothetical protein
MKHRIMMIFALILAFSGAVTAQTGGQFCVRAFEDRNANGLKDDGEPLLTRGVSANLQNAEGVVIASALLDDSPTAAQGVMCFQFLEAQEYTLSLTSADYTPTTATTFTEAINIGAIPTLVEYGAQRADFAVTPADVTEAPPVEEAIEDALPRVVLSGLGALLVMAGMVVLGGFIYLVVFHRKGQTRPTDSTGRLIPVSMTDTGNHAAVPADKTQETDALDSFLGEEPPIEADDTNPIKPV